MKHQVIKTKRYGWTIDWYFDVSYRDIPVVMRKLEYMGFPYEKLDSAYQTMMGGGLNYGITEIDVRSKGIVVVIGNTSSDIQFFNTTIHELLHVVMSIGHHEGLDLIGEPIAYLQGDIAGAMEPIIEHFLVKFHHGNDKHKTDTEGSITV